MRQLLSGAVSAVAVIVCLALPWPFGPLVVGAGLVGLLFVRRSRLLSRELLLAGFVGGALVLVASGLASGVMTGQPWLTQPAAAGLELAVAALGASVIVVPTRRR